MEAFVFELDEEVAQEAGKGGGSFGVLDTGIYDVTITTATLGKTKGGNNKLDLSIVTEDGHEHTIYQAFVLDKKWKTGKDNFGYKDWQAFAVIAGLKSITTFAKPLLKEDNTPILKNGDPIVLNAVKELEGKKVKLALVKEIDIYRGSVTEDNIVFASFTKEGLNANEKVNSLEPEVLGKISERLSDKKTKRYKKFIADGGVADETTPKEGELAEAPVDLSDLGLD